MGMHGHAKIELHNVKTGEDQVIEKDNLVTNLWGDTLNAYRKYCCGFTNCGCRPAIPNNGFTKDYYGGIVCFQDPIQEDVHNYFGQLGNIETAYAYQNSTESTDTKVGILNANKTETLENGWTFVWDWTQEEGNGQISSVCLTSNLGGKFGCGDASTRWTGIPFGLQSNGGNSAYASSDKTMMLSRVSRLNEDGYLYAVRGISATEVEVWKINTCKQKAAPNNLFFQPYAGIIPYESFTLTLSANSIMYKSATDIRSQWFDMGDFLWGFANEGNSEGNATLYWCKIQKADWSVSEGSFLLNEAHLHAIANSRQSNAQDTSSTFYGELAEGYLFIPNYAMTGIYKINPNNGNLTFIDTKRVYTDNANQADYNIAFPDSQGGWGVGPQNRYVLKYLGSKIYNGCNVLDPINEELIVMPRQLFIDGRYLHHPLQVGHTPLYVSFGYDTTGNYPWRAFGTYWWINPSYLATINNLEEPVVKTADMTMRITYTITFGEEE